MRLTVVCPTRGVVSLHDCKEMRTRIEWRGGKEKVYRDLRGLENVFRGVSPAEAGADGLFNGTYKGGGEFVAGAELEEEEDAFLDDVSLALIQSALPSDAMRMGCGTHILIAWPSLAHAYTILDHVRELRVDDTVNFCAAEADSGGIQHAVRAAKEDDGFCGGVFEDEVAVRPDVVEAGEVGAVELLVGGVAPKADGHVREGLEGRALVGSGRCCFGFRCCGAYGRG